VEQPIDISDALQLDLTEDFLLGLHTPVAPIVAGDTWDLRLQVRDATDVPVSLAGAKIALVVKKTSAPAAPEIFQRDSASDCADAPGVKQIEADADQVNENTGASTGKGWLTVRFRPGDEATLLTAVASRWYDLRIRFGDGSVRLVCAGRFQVRRPVTTNNDIPA
jgi:hypothetical protein